MVCCFGLQLILSLHLFARTTLHVKVKNCLLAGDLHNWQKSSSFPHGLQVLKICEVNYYKNYDETFKETMVKKARINSIKKISVQKLICQGFQVIEAFQLGAKIN